MMEKQFKKNVPLEEEADKGLDAYKTRIILEADEVDNLIATLNEEPDTGAEADAEPARLLEGEPSSPNWKLGFHDRSEDETLLLGEIEKEIENLTHAQKAAYEDAVHHCPVTVMDKEANPMWFLRKHRNNAAAAARNLADYWTTRVQIFGPDRAFKPLLDLRPSYGALRNAELALLTSDLIYLLPKDRHGRQVFFWRTGCIRDEKPWLQVSAPAVTMFVLTWALQDPDVHAREIVFIAYSGQINFLLQKRRTPGTYESSILLGLFPFHQVPLVILIYNEPNPLLRTMIWGLRESELGRLGIFPTDPKRDTPRAYVEPTLADLIKKLDGVGIDRAGLPECIDGYFLFADYLQRLQGTFDIPEEFEEVVLAAEDRQPFPVEDVDSPDIIEGVLGFRKAILELPERETIAYREAASRDPDFVESQARMRQFLVREGMDLEKAAHRLMSYWNKRLEIFGSEQALRPMAAAVDGALTENDKRVVAMKYSMLGHSDSRGRCVWCIELSKLLEYCSGTSASVALLRHAFYMLSVICENEAKAATEGFVQLIVISQPIWPSNNFLEQVATFIDTVFPTMRPEVHVILLTDSNAGDSSDTVLQSASSFLSRWKTNTSSIIICESAELIPSRLHKYGIRRRGLPPWMGGSRDFDKWWTSRKHTEVKQLVPKEKQLQLRRERNKLDSQLKRKRRKQEVTFLKAEVERLTCENTKLKRENVQLESISVMVQEIVGTTRSYADVVRGKN